MTHHQRFLLLNEIQVKNDPTTNKKVLQNDPVTLQLVPGCFADVARPLWSYVLVLRGVISDPPGAAANTTLVLLHYYVMRGKVEGLCPGSQIWSMIIDFPTL